MKSYLTGLLAVAFIFTSCKKEPVNTPAFEQTLLKIGQAKMTSGELVTLYSVDSLTTGYQQIFIKVTNGDQAVANAKMTLSTLMAMGIMVHSSPSVNPEYLSQSMIYEAGAVFTMPGTDQWSLIVTVNEEELHFKINVAQAKTKTVGTFTATNGVVYVLSLYPAKNFRVGMNDFSLFVAKKETSMKFSPVSGLQVEFIPEMTSMGHSSPNNVNPTDAGNGFYHGKVNFTMTGDWRFNFKLKSDGMTILEDAYLDIVF